MNHGDVSLCFRILVLYGAIILVAIIAREYIVRSMAFTRNEENCRSDTTRQISDIRAAYNPFTSRCEWNKVSELSSASVSLRYNCTSRMCVSLEKDQETCTWIDKMLQKRRSVFTTWLSSTISKFPGSNQYISKAILAKPEVYLLSKEQWKYFITTALNRANKTVNYPLNRVLDIGASNGDITHQFTQLFLNTWVTDVSTLTHYRQKWNGFSNSFITSEISTQVLLANNIPTQYDVVFLLNVLDQLVNPIEFLKNILEIMQYSGDSTILIVSVPLPWTSKTETKFSIPGDNWIESVKNMITLFHAMKLDVLAISRAPYLCQGTYQVPLFSLDTAIIALKLL